MVNIRILKRQSFAIEFGLRFPPRFRDDLIAHRDIVGDFGDRERQRSRRRFNAGDEHHRIFGHDTAPPPSRPAVGESGFQTLEQRYRRAGELCRIDFGADPAQEIPDGLALLPEK